LTPEDEAECRRVVFEYAKAKNEWDVLKYIFDRLQAGMHVAPGRASLVAGLSEEEFHRRHVQMFSSYIYPRDRKYGAKPGGPTMISRDGPFGLVDASSITRVTERNHDTVEVVTDWTYVATEGETMFVLKKKSGHWLIDSLKTSYNGSDWENKHL
jgi:hypothetical protein